MRLLVAMKVIIDLSTFWKFGSDGSHSGLAAERIARGAVLLFATILAFANAYKREGCNQDQYGKASNGYAHNCRGGNCRPFVVGRW
jgi:hypothetical protein